MTLKKQTLIFGLITLMGISVFGNASAAPGSAIDNVKLRIQQEIEAPADVNWEEETQLKVQFKVEEDGKVEVIAVEGEEEEGFMDSIKQQLLEISFDQAETLQNYIFSYTLTFIRM